MESLHLLRGKKLVSVKFILDYVEFAFEDLILAALADPILTTGQDTVLRHGQSGYRDALCGEIGNSIVETSETANSLVITMDDGKSIVVPLDAPVPPGPEMATLSGRGTFFQAWVRP
jgi:hypothetical protein